MLMAIVYTQHADARTHSDYCVHFNAAACRACVRRCAAGVNLLKDSPQFKKETAGKNSAAAR